MDKYQKIREYQKIFESQYFQAYCQIKFATGKWTWGTIYYRREMSGRGYEFDFSTLDQALEFLEKLTTQP